MIILGSLFIAFAVLSFFEADTKTESKQILRDRDAFNKSFRDDRN